MERSGSWLRRTETGGKKGGKNCGRHRLAVLTAIPATRVALQGRGRVDTVDLYVTFFN